MKKTFLALALLATIASAQAQSWRSEISDEQFDQTFEGCQRASDGSVDCVVTFKPLKDGTLFLYSDDYRAVSPDGTTYQAEESRLANGEFTRLNSAYSVYANLPARVTIRFTDFPTGTNTVARLMLNDKSFSNVSLAGTRPAPAPAAARPTTAVPTANASRYGAELSNCRPLAGGKLACDAVLTPR